MPAKTTKSVRRQEERRKAARDAGIVEANVARCLEHAELGPKHCNLLKAASQILVKSVDSSAALRAVQTSQAGERFKFGSGDAMPHALEALGATCDRKSARKWRPALPKNGTRAAERRRNKNREDSRL